MKKSLHISASFDQPEFLEDLVEKLAWKHNEIGYGKAEVPKGYEALETSSIEAYVSGDVKLSFNKTRKRDDDINMPFITCFMFTCKKAKDGQYKLAWSTSLS